MEDQWLSWAKRLQAIASTGLHFGAEDYDLERYAEIGDIAQQMLASLGQVPLNQIQALVPNYAQGYATPLVDVRGAVFKDDEVLLVKERTDGLWTLPGGYADVGYSAAENVVKEISEEANVDVRTQKLYAVQHKAKHAYRQDIRDFYKFFFLCEAAPNMAPSPGAECLAVGFFGLKQLPPLSIGRTIVKDIEAAFRHRDDLGLATAFD